MLAKWRLLLVMVLAGALGMALFQGGRELWKDWRFLHLARVIAEQQRMQTKSVPSEAGQ